MQKDPIIIKDPDVRLRTNSDKLDMERHNAETLARAEQREKELLESPGLIDTFIIGIDNLSKMFSRKKKAKMEILQQRNKSKEK